MQLGTFRSALGLLACGLLLAPGAASAQQAPAKPGAKPASKPVDFSKDRTLYEIGYSHLDTEWRWSYPQVIREFLPSTLRDNFKLFDKYPDYVFNWTGSNRYKLMKEYYPEDYAKLKAYVAAGCGSRTARTSRRAMSTCPRRSPSSGRFCTATSSSGVSSGSPPMSS